MWIRQCDLDADNEAPLPIPARIASNEEFIPPQQSPQQKEYEARLNDISERAAKRQGLDAARLPPHRLGVGRGALRAQPGLRRLLRRERRGDRGPEGVRGEVAQGPVHLRHPDPPRRCRQEVVRRHAARARPRCDSSRCCGRSPAVAEKSLELLNRAHYVKEVFGDSDTVMAVISGVPSARVGQEPAAARPDGRDAEVRQRPGRLAARPLARPAAPQPGREGTRGDGAAGQGTEDRRLEDVHRAPNSARRRGSSTTRRSPIRSGSGRRNSASRTSASTRGCRSASSTRRRACRSTWRRPRRTGRT